MAKEKLTAEAMLKERDSLRAELAALEYSGMPEIKARGGRQYLYTRRRIEGRLTSTYVGPYSEELYSALKENGTHEHELRIALRRIEKKLAGRLPDADGGQAAVWLVLAKKRRSELVANEAPLIGLTADRKRILDLLNNGVLTGIPMQEIGQVMALSRAWDAVLEQADSRDPLDTLLRFGRLIGGTAGGKLRVSEDENDPAPDPEEARERMSCIINGEGPARERSVALFLYCLRARLLQQQNDCAALLLANRLLIPASGCVIDIPPDAYPEFRALRDGFILGGDRGALTHYIFNRCVDRV